MISGLEEPIKFDPDFDIYVTSDKHFKSGFLKLPIEYKPKESEKFVRKAKFSLDDSYFASIAAGYILGNKGGFSREHFQSQNQPKIISWIAKYFRYFHMHRFLQNTSTLQSLLSYDELVMVQKLVPVTKIWKRKFFDTKEIPILWWREQKKKGREIRDVQAEHYADGDGQLGIVYHKCVGENPVDVENDFMRYIPEKSLGLTPLGTKYFQQAIESLTSVRILF